MSKNEITHWICGTPGDEKIKLNVGEFYRQSLNATDGECESCVDDGRTALEFEKNGPYVYRLYSPLEQDPKCQAIDVLFKEPTSVGEIKLQNYYTAYINVLMRMENHRNWETMIDHEQLMPFAHFETGSRWYFGFYPKTEWNNVTEIRIVLRQPSPNWKRFGVENLRIFQQRQLDQPARNYLTYLIRKTTEALKMERKNDKSSSTIPFHIGTYGYEIDKLIRF